MKGLQTISATPELNYLTQIVFLLYEDTQEPPDSPQRYTVSIHFSPGIRHRERLLRDGNLAGNNPGSHCDCRVSIHDIAHNSQPTCNCSSCSSCNHSIVLNQRLSRLVSQAAVEKRASPFRKLSHVPNLTDLQKDYEEMQTSPVSRNFSRRRSVSELHLPSAANKERGMLRRVKSETMLPVGLDAPLDEEEDNCTPQLHSPQLSNSVSSASIHGWLHFHVKIQMLFSI